MPRNDDTFDRLMAVIESRKGATADKSYTASLLAGGVEKIGAKITEEAGEVVDAAREQGAAGHDHVVHEAADLIYHLFVLLSHRDVTLKDVRDELARRFATSGHEEKSRR